MGRWDKRESELDNKLKKYSEKISSKQSSNSPAWLRKFEFRIAHFKLKYGIKLTIRQFWAAILGINLFVWFIFPLIVNPPEPWRLFILIASWLLYFIIDKGDGSRRKKDPPEDGDSGENYPSNNHQSSMDHYDTVHPLTPQN